MALRWYTVVVDSHDPAAQGRWWAETLGWQIAYEADGETVVVSPTLLDEDKKVPPAEQQQGLVFVTVPETKSIKNRLHLDLAPSTTDDHAAEVEKLIARGARRVNVGQDPAVHKWVVLADPEGNEFCVLTPRD